MKINITYCSSHLSGHVFERIQRDQFKYIKEVAFIVTRRSQFHTYVKGFEGGLLHAKSEEDLNLLVVDHHTHTIAFDLKLRSEKEWEEFLFGMPFRHKKYNRNGLTKAVMKYHRELTGGYAVRYVKEIMWNPVLGEVKRGIKIKMGEYVSWASLKRMYNLLQHPLMDDQLWEDVVNLSQVHQ